MSKTHLDHISNGLDLIDKISYHYTERYIFQRYSAEFNHQPYSSSKSSSFHLFPLIFHWTFSLSRPIQEINSHLDRDNYAGPLKHPTNSDCYLSFGCQMIFLMEPFNAYSLVFPHSDIRLGTAKPIKQPKQLMK